MRYIEIRNQIIIMNIGQQALKPLSIFGGALLMFTGIFHIFAELSYTKTVVCVYLSWFVLRIFSIIIWSGTLNHALVENYYSSIFPFLSNDVEKGIFMILISFLCFGGEFGLGGIISGMCLIIGGSGYLIFGLFGHPSDQSQSSPPKTDQSGYEPPDLISN